MRTFINQNCITLRDLIEEIETQTDYLVVFRNQDVNLDQQISFKEKSGKIGDYLLEVSERTGLNYRFDDNYITFSRVKDTLSIAQTKRLITGKIIDIDGEPIIGANVVEKGTTNGTITDMDGNFTLEVSGKALLVVSYIGYVTQEIIVDNKENITIKMYENAEALDEVVVIGYGT